MSIKEVGLKKERELRPGQEGDKMEQPEVRIEGAAFVALFALFAQ